MSSQDDHLSGQNFGLLVIFTAHIIKRREKNTFSVLKFLWLANTTGNSPGSEINFLMWAPTGEQVQIIGRQTANNYGSQNFPLAAWKRATRIDRSCCEGIFTGRFVSLLN